MTIKSLIFVNFPFIVFINPDRMAFPWRLSRCYRPRFRSYRPPIRCHRPRFRCYRSRFRWHSRRCPLHGPIFAPIAAHFRAALPLAAIGAAFTPIGAAFDAIGRPFAAIGRPFDAIGVALAL
jgi:hypothetical protein